MPKKKVKKIKVKRKKINKKTTNYKKLGAAGLGGTILGTLATRGMFDRKQLLNIKECDKRIKEMNEKFAEDRESMENECNNKLNRMEIKYQGKINSLLGTIKTLETAVEQLKKENNEFKNLNEGLGFDLQKSEQEREQLQATFHSALDYIQERGGLNAYNLFISGEWNKSRKTTGKYVKSNSFGQKNFSKKQLMTMLNNKKISKKQLLTMLVSSIVSGGATRVYSKRECDKRIMEICGSNVTGTIPRQKNTDFEKIARKMSEQAQEENMFLKKENNELKEKIKELEDELKDDYWEDAKELPIGTLNELYNTEFGKRKKKVKKIPSSLKKKCKRLKVRLTMKRGGKRVYKSEAILKKQCKKAIKKKRK